MTDDAPVRVLIVEDHPLFAHVLRLYLENVPELIVVDCVRSAEEALAHPHLQDVDVVVTDIGLPRLSGIGSIPRLHQVNPALRVIVMSGSVHEETAEDAYAAGAAAYLEKGPIGDDLVAQILSVARDGFSSRAPKGT